ncbi:MAG: hypothetical protein OXF41_08070 [bacterium]|nr:hypothetical protein [bacterium]
MLSRHYWPWVVDVAGYVAALAAIAGVARYGTWYIPVVALPVALAALPTSLVLWTRLRQYADAQLRVHRQLVVSVTSAVGGTVMVVLAVLVGTVDAAAWQALRQEGLVGQLVVAPLLAVAGGITLVMWVYIGCLVQAFTPTAERWAWLRETAAVVVVFAAAVLPTLLVVVVYQMWRLVDVRIATTAGGM